MECRCLILSKPGGRSTNEDAGGYWVGDSHCCAVLSDGAGGHGGGDVASKLVVRECLEHVRGQVEGDAAFVDGAMRRANRSIVEEQARQPRYADMRATVALLVIDRRRETALWGHYGDTRLYCFRHRRIAFQTKDHSVVQAMVDAGYLEASKLRSSPDRSKLTGGLGDVDHYLPTLAERDWPIVDGDIFLMCTDGLWEYVDEEFMERSLLDSRTPEEWLARLEACALAKAGPGQDNYSALTVWCSNPAEVTIIRSGSASD